MVPDELSQRQNNKEKHDAEFYLSSISHGEFDHEQCLSNA